MEFLVGNQQMSIDKNALKEQNNYIKIKRLVCMVKIIQKKQKKKWIKNICGEYDREKIVVILGC